MNFSEAEEITVVTAPFSHWDKSVVGQVCAFCVL